MDDARECMRKMIKKWKNRGIVLLSDCCVVILTWVIVHWITHSFGITLNFQAFIPLLCLIQVVLFFIFGLYRGIWSFASIPDFIRILQSALIGACLIFSIMYFKQSQFIKGILVIYSMTLILLLSAPRILVRWLKEHRYLFVHSDSVLIIGAGSAGESIVRDLLRFVQKKYKPIGLVDDDLSKQGREIQGVRVIGTCDHIPDLVKKLQIKLILIAVPSATSSKMRRIVSLCEQAKVPFRTLPGLQNLADGQVSLNKLRDVAIEDLLGREQVTLEWERIRTSLCDKKILVSGGGGSIGSELCRQIAAQKPSYLIIIDNNEFNLYSIDKELRKQFPDLALQIALISVTDRVGLRKLFAAYRPDLVFHAAAYKHVPLLENQLRVAIYNNIIGTRILSEIACDDGVKQFILISTDKAVNPTNIMGATKRASEVFCQNMNFYSETKFITVRFGNVLDSAGSVIPLFRQQLREGGPITVTDPNISRYFMTIPEASQLILQAATMGKGGEIFVLDMGEPVKIRYLAEQLIKLSGKELEKDIHIHYTGLRPGEKMHEELFHENETLCATEHQKIYQAHVRRYDWMLLQDTLDLIELAYKENNETELSNLLFRLVPEYKLSVSNSNILEKISEAPLCLKKSLSYV